MDRVERVLECRTDFSGLCLLSPIAYMMGETKRGAERRTVRQLLAEALGRDGEVSYDYTATGAPHLRERPDLHISISHTKGYAVVALSGEEPIGIDIECYGAKVERVASKYLRPEELTLVTASHDPVMALHLLWTAKEAAFKLVNPPSGSLQSFLCQRLPERNESGSLVLTHMEAPEPCHITIHYENTPEYILCLALREPRPHQDTKPCSNAQ